MPEPNGNNSQRLQRQTSNNDIKNNTKVEGEWEKNGADVIFHNGKVGINTPMPTEALTVNGNILVTGDYYKPSDKRIKSDFKDKDKDEQLEHIRHLKLYDYKVGERDESGVIAQELEVVIPRAVHNAGDVTMNGKEISNLLVVNERVLLYENIGATQALDRNLEEEREHIEEINVRVDELAEQTSQETQEIKTTMQKIVDVLCDEERPANKANLPEETEPIKLNLSIFGVGPARSLFILGWFFPPLWLIGSFFCFSQLPARRQGGRVNVIGCVIFVFVWMLNTKGRVRDWDGAMLGFQIVGWCLLIIRAIAFWKQRRRARQHQADLLFHLSLQQVSLNANQRSPQASSQANSQQQHPPPHERKTGSSISLNQIRAVSQTQSAQGGPTPYYQNSEYIVSLSQQQQQKQQQQQQQLQQQQQQQYFQQQQQQQQYFQQV